MEVSAGESATRRPLSLDSWVSRSNKLLYGTTDPQTQNPLDINTRRGGIVTFIMDQPTKKRQRNPMSEEQKKRKGRRPTERPDTSKRWASFSGIA
jgi:hypothetical protein